MPLTFGEYKWNNNFLDYGYLKITNITKNIKNFKKSSFKRNYNLFQITRSTIAV